MSKFEDWFTSYLDENFTVNDEEKMKCKATWNAALDYARNKLAGKMRTEYGLTIGDDKQVVDWNEIEHTLDKLKEDG